MKNLIITIMFMISAKEAFASNSTTCHAKVLTSPCGSGNIEVSFDINNKSFQLKHGDVGCWFIDINIGGQIIEENTSQNLFSPKKFKLVNNDDNTEIGNLVYRAQNRYQDSLAQLIVIPNKFMSSQGAMFGRYNLECEN